MTTKIAGEAQSRTAFTYNAAADSYNPSRLSFWNYFGARTIELLSLPVASQVLDVCETGLEKVREANLTFISDEKILSIQTNVLYALATKSPTANE